MSDIDWIECVRWCHADQSLDVAHFVVGQLLDLAQRSNYTSPILTFRIQTSDSDARGYMVMHLGALGGLGRMRIHSTSTVSISPQQRVKVLSEIVRHLCQQAFEQGAELVQAITPIEFNTESNLDEMNRADEELIALQSEHELALATVLTPVAILVQMECRVSSSCLVRRDEHRSADAWITVAPHTAISRQAWEQLVDSTYTNTLDVPELNGVRSIEQTLKGYASGSTSEPDTWWVIRMKDRPVGCLLVTTLDASRIELTYVGIIAPLRGKQISGRIMDFLFDWVIQHSIDTIQLAVDRRNIPAIRLYLRNGFQPKGFVRAWVRPRSDGPISLF